MAKLTMLNKEEKEIGLENICDGHLDIMFKEKYSEILRQLQPGKTAEIGIKIKIDRFSDGSAKIGLDAEMTMKLPKSSGIGEIAFIADKKGNQLEFEEVSYE